MNNWKLWLESFIILVHAAFTVKQDSEAVKVISKAAHELHINTGSKKHYHFPVCNIITGEKL